MKRIIYLLLAVFLAGSINLGAQVTIGAQSDPQAFSVLELISEGKRGLRLPQLTTAEKNTLTNSAQFQAKKTTDARGLMIFNKDTQCVEVWSGSEWISRCEEDQYICDTPAAPGTITFTGTGSALNLNAIFTARVTAVEGMTYNWTVPYGLEIATNSNNQITVKVVKAGSYPLNLVSVTATNACGNTSTATTGSSSSSLIVNNCASAPTLTSAAIVNNTVVAGAKSGTGTQANPYTLYVGQSISLTYIGGVAGETYAWSLNTNGNNHFSVETNNGTFLQLRAKDVSSTAAADAIGLTASNECDATARISSTIYIKVETISYPTITGSTAGSNCGTGTVTLNATASSGAAVRWYEAATGGAVLSTGTSFTTPSLTASKTYYAEAYNTAENTTSLNRTAVAATINAIPVLTKAKDASRAGAGTVNLSGCATTSTSGASVRYFSVASGGTALTNSTTASLSVGSHTFYAEAYTATCTSARIAIAVTVTAGTGMAASPDPSSITVPAEGTDAQRTTATITVTNPDCLTTGNYSFAVTAGGTYAAIASSNASAGTFAVRFTSENTATSTRTATVTVTDPCGNTKAFTFTQAATSVVAVTSVTITNTETSVVIGSTLTMKATVAPSNATNSTVTWTRTNGTGSATINSSTGVLTPSAAGTVTVTATAGGKTASKTITVVAACSGNPVVTISSNPAQASIKAGNNVTLTATVTGGGSLTYKWYKNNTVISGATSNTYAITSIVLGDHYACEVSNGCGTTTTYWSTCGAATVDGGWLVFMCHNLGADTSLDPFTPNEGLYGDLYQWGRPTDGHEKRNSETTSVLATSNIPGHAKFIKNNTTSPYDWRSGGGNTTRWGDGTAGVNPQKGINDPCPSGWKVPSQSQWGSIYQGGTTSGHSDAAIANNWSWVSTGGGGFKVGSSLFLPAAGLRGNNGTINYTGAHGVYWSSSINTTINNTFSHYLSFNSTGGVFPASYNSRASGVSVRCVADN